MLLESRKVEVVEVLVVITPILFPCIGRSSRVGGCGTISITVIGEAKGWGGIVVETIRVVMDMSGCGSTLEVVSTMSG